MKSKGWHNRVLVIGYGNTLRGDDGFGPYVASLLSDQLAFEWVTIQSLQQLTPDLAEHVARHEVTILIDAQEGDSPGTIHHHVIQTPDSASPTYHHHITPEVLAGVTKALYGKDPDLRLYSVEAVSFEIGEGLSPAAASAVQAVIQEIMEFLQGKSQARCYC